MQYALVAASLAAAAYAAPVVERQAGPTDPQILNYALTLEHLENAFYRAGLKNFTDADFQKAGAEPDFFNNLKTIGKDEESHVSFLSGALGSAAVEPCTYNFGVTNAASFLQTAQILEGVGVSAYLGAAKSIMSKDYLTAAGSILTVESRHSAYIRHNQNPELSPFPFPYDIPLDFNEVYSLAALFITGCPSGNAAKLPALKAFPALTASPAGIAKFGDKLSLKAAKSVNAKAAWFITSQGPASAPLTGSGTDYQITVPSGMPPKGAQNGQEYLVLTSDANKPTDDNIVAGPAVIEIQDDAFGFKPTPIASAPSYGGSSPAPSQPAGNPYGSYGKYGGYGSYSGAAGGKVTQIGDGQPQAAPGAAKQIPDGQVQAPAAGAAKQIPDGQVQAPGPKVTQIGDGQIQSPKATQIADGQIQSPKGY